MPLEITVLPEDKERADEALGSDPFKGRSIRCLLAQAIMRQESVNFASVCDINIAIGISPFRLFVPDDDAKALIREYDRSLHGSEFRTELPKTVRLDELPGREEV